MRARILDIVEENDVVRLVFGRGGVAQWERREKGSSGFARTTNEEPVQVR